MKVRPTGEAGWNRGSLEDSSLQTSFDVCGDEPFHFLFFSHDNTRFHGSARHFL